MCCYGGSRTAALESWRNGIKKLKRDRREFGWSEWKQKADLWLLWIKQTVWADAGGAVAIVSTGFWIQNGLHALRCELSHQNWVNYWIKKHYYRWIRPGPFVTPILVLCESFWPTTKLTFVALTVVLENPTGWIHFPQSIVLTLVIRNAALSSGRKTNDVPISLSCTCTEPRLYREKIIPVQQQHVSIATVCKSVC